MVKLLLLLRIVCLTTITVSVQAQEAFAVAGGNLIENAGSVSYSVGQTFYSYIAGSNGSATEGVHYTLKVEVLSVNDELIDGLQLDVFPNPASHFLKLESKQFELKDLSYSLLDINGRIHLMGELHERSTTVNLQLLPAAIYILRVTDGSEIIKTFKIIKL